MSRSSSLPPDEATPVQARERDVTIVDSRPADSTPQADGGQARREAPGHDLRHEGQVNGGHDATEPGRDPIARLDALFDQGSVTLLLPADDAGVLASEGLI